jgi:hypothetical protein
MIHGQQNIKYNFRWSQETLVPTDSPGLSSARHTSGPVRSSPPTMNSPAHAAAMGSPILRSNLKGEGIGCVYLVSVSRYKGLDDAV